MTWGRGFVAWEPGKAAQRERRATRGAERPAARTFGFRWARASAREAGGRGHPWEPEGVHGGTPPPPGGDTGGEARLAEERATRCEGQSRTITEMDEGSRRGSDVTGRAGH